MQIHPISIVICNVSLNAIKLCECVKHTRYIQPFIIRLLNPAV